MIRRIRQLPIACLLLSALEVQAMPVQFEFTAAIHSYGTAGGGIPVPTPFEDSSWVFNAPITGSFNIETDTPGTPSYIREDGAWIEAGTYYANPVTQLALNIGDQHFSFATSSPPIGSDVWESSISVIDRPVPSGDPTTNYDSYDIDVDLGPGVFPGPFAHLSAFFTLNRSERDLSLISSRDMLANLAPSENWHAFFTIYDSAVPGRSYQIHAPITNIAQVTPVPVPAPAALLAVGFALAAWRGRRTQPAMV